MLCYVYGCHKTNACILSSFQDGSQLVCAVRPFKMQSSNKSIHTAVATSIHLLIRFDTYIWMRRIEAQASVGCVRYVRGIECHCVPHPPQFSMDTRCECVCVCIAICGMCASIAAHLMRRHFAHASTKAVYTWRRRCRFDSTNTVWFGSDARCEAERLMARVAGHSSTIAYPYNTHIMYASR